MLLSSAQKQTLFTLLEQSGWTWREDTIYAPNETMWLIRDNPWTGDLVDFHARMCERRSRIAANGGVGSAICDVDSLVTALEVLYR